MGHRIISFTIDNERILRILDKAGKYKLRSALIVRALEVVDLEELLRELLQELLHNEELIQGLTERKELPTGPVMDKTRDVERTQEDKVRKFHERFSDLL